MSFDLHEGETLAILGESGSGKSVTAQAIMGILDSPPGFITGGEVRYCGKTSSRCREEQRRAIRGPEISMVFQDALSSLNPVFPVGWQIAEMFRKHRGMNKSDAQDRGRPAHGAGADPGAPSSASRPTRTSSPAACGSAS